MLPQKTICVLILGAVHVAGCASTGSTRAGAPVTYDPTVDFDAYRTFALLAEPSGASGMQRSVSPEVTNAVVRSLEALQLTRVVANPGLLVATAPGGSPIASDSPAHSAAFATSIRMADVDPGSLVVDLVDGRSRRLVWRGVAEGALTSPDALAPALERLFRGYYPARPAFYKKAP